MGSKTTTKAVLIQNFLRFRKLNFTSLHFIEYKDAQKHAIFLLNFYTPFNFDYQEGRRLIFGGVAACSTTNQLAANLSNVQS
jgi:hypothetical protein